MSDLRKALGEFFEAYLVGDGSPGQADREQFCDALKANLVEVAEPYVRLKVMEWESDATKRVEIFQLIMPAMDKMLDPMVKAESRSIERNFRIIVGAASDKNSLVSQGIRWGMVLKRLEQIRTAIVSKNDLVMAEVIQKLVRRIE